MSKFSDLLSSLSPQQQALLALKLRQAGNQFNAFPTSFAQQRLWFLDQMESGSSFYNISVAARLTGDLNREVMEQSLSEVLKRHEALRTTFAVVDGQPVQVINPAEPLAIPVVDLRALPEAEREPEAFHLIREQAKLPFDLFTGPLLRITLLRLADQEQFVILIMHHIISDGWSGGILIQELGLLYESLSSHKPARLPQLPIQYADFAVWQRQWLEQDGLNADLSYWKEQLADLPFLELPADRPRPAVQRFFGATQSLTFPRDLSRSLESLSQLENATLFMTLLTAFKVLLYRYTGQDDIVVGTPVAGRNRAEVENLIGLFINTLVLRTDFSGEPNFKDALRRVRKVFLDAFEHQDVPFDKLVQELQPERSLSHSPLFQVAFALQNAHSQTLELPNLKLTPLDVETSTARFDFGLSIMEVAGSLEASVEYNTDLFDTASIARLLKHLQTLMQSIVSDPDQQISRLQLLTSAELRQVLEEWNDGQFDFSNIKCAHELFEEQVEKTPHHIALSFQHQSLSYLQLNSQANQLARRLLAEGLHPHSVVALCLERSLDLVVSLLACLKSGAAFLPLDPEYPSDRLAFMLADSRARLLLTDRSLADRFPSVTTLLIDDGRLDTGLYGTDNLPPRATPSDLAYLIYTSGTTGSPKAVMVEHRNLAATLRAACNEFGFDHNDRMAVIASYSFDIFLFELMCPLLGGGRAVLLSKDEVLDVAGLVITIRELTQLHCVPSLMRQILSHLAETGAQGGYRRLKRIYIGGDAVAADLLERMRGVFADSEIVVLYGPTETTIISSRHRVRAGEQGQRQLIGRAFDGERLLICDARANPLPVGVAGEILIAGHGLTRGYWGQEGLTEQKYISVLGERCYRTGDRGRYVAGGEVEFLGRLDQQIKIRGMRVEVGEVEAVLGRHEEVKGCVVVGVEDDRGEKRLVAYIVSRGNGESGVRAGVVRRLREYMKGSLPGQMQPAQYVEIGAIPVNRNGKVDRRALPVAVPERGELEKEYEEAQTEKQRKLVEIWGQVLGIEGIGIRDNFFELGGDSILSIQIIARANQAGMKLSPKQLFQNQTIAELAAVAEATAEVRAEQGVLSGEVMLTPIQRWFFAEGKKRPEHFNQSVMLEASRPFRVEGLRKAVAGLINHHDMLRLRVSTEGPQIAGHLASQQEDVVVVVDLTEVGQRSLQHVMQRAGEQLQASLNLEQGPIVRVAVLDTASGSSVMIVIHHLAVDGVSWRILLDDLQKAYEQAAGGLEVELGSKTSSYRQWAKALESFSQREQTSQEAAYWEGQKWLNVKPLPVDRQGENTAGSIEVQQVRLTEEETERLLREVPEAYHTRIDEVLVTALTSAVSHWTGERQLLIEMEGHGREEIEDDIDVTRTVGWFTAIYPLLIEVGQGLEQTLKQVKQEIRSVPSKGISYGVMKFMAGAEAAQRLSTDLQPEISFNYLGQFDQVMRESQALRVLGGGIGREQSADESRNHLIEVNGLVSGSELSISFSYSRNRHLAQTIAGLAHQMIDSLRELIEASHTGSAQCLIASDFQAVELEQQEIERLAARYGLIEHIYPLTPLQEGLLFHTIYEPDSGIYVGQMRCQLKGELDAQAMSRAWMAEADRHDLLRSSIEWEGLKKPVLIVGSAARTQLRVEDWRGFEPRQQQALLDDYLREERRQGFDLGGGETMRVAIIRTGEQEHELLWSHHHMVLDGWSAAIVLKGVFGGYAKAVRGETPEQEEKRRGYGDYIRWLKRQDMTKAEQYWRAALKGFLTPTPLMPDYAAASRPQAETIHGKQETRLDQATTIALTAKARKQQLTISTLVQGAWALILSRYSGEPDVVFGSTVSGRPVAIAGIEQMVGLFINTLPMRVKVADDKELAQWLKEIQQQAVEMREYEYTPLVEAQRWSELSAGQGLFETILVYENYPVEKGLLEEVGGLEVERLRVEEKTNYPISVVVGPGQELVLRIEYERGRYEEGTIERVLEQMKRVLVGMGEEREKRVGELEMMREAEREEVIYKWNETGREYRRELCIQEMFEGEVEGRPESVSVIYEDEMVSYEELNRRANQLAHYLMSQGVGPESLVGICLERSIEMVVAVIAVLKAGGAYVPLDPEYPQARITYMMTDTAARVLLTQSHLVERLGEAAANSKLVEVDAGRAEISRQPDSNPVTTVCAENLCYVIYTSGSTGLPKGAMNTHRGIINRLLWTQETFPLGGADRVLQIASLSFDFSAWEIFGALGAGAAIVLPKPGGQRDSRHLLDLICRHEVTMLHFVPSMLRVMLEEEGLDRCLSLKLVYSGGEALSEELKQKYEAVMAASLVNQYGPTETSIDVAYWESERGKAGVSIGRANANNRLYVVDERREAVAVGVVGEIEVGGEAVGRGYWRDAGKTAARYLPDQYGLGAGERVYATGDLARYRGDGNLTYVGRKDQQVKVRGYRIELGEIESLLESEAGVKQAAVVVKEEGGQKRLIGYVAMSDDQQLEEADIKRRLRSKLPDYMVPARIVLLEQMPLMTNGKLDRQALPYPEPKQGEKKEEYEGPRTFVEEILEGIWIEVLGIKSVDRQDNFFELGGHSLLATQAISRIRNSFNLEIPLRTLFEFPVLAELAENIEAMMGGEQRLQSPPILRLSREAELPLSFAQQRLWFLDQLESGSSPYNTSAALKLTGSLNVDALKRSLDEIVRRHESLRTSFVETKGSVFQVINPPDSLVLPVIDLLELPEHIRQAEMLRVAVKEVQRPFILSQAPLFRVVLLQLGEEEYVALLIMHHIVSDGWSAGILIYELSILYEAFISDKPALLPQLPIQYADFAVWQRQWLQGDVLEAELAYWKQQLQEAPPVLELQTDHPRPIVQSTNGASESFYLPKDLSEELKRISRKENATLFMTLASAFNSLLFRYTNQSDIIIGTPIASRNRPEIEPLIGFFVNSLVLRTQLSSQLLFRHLLRQVREVALGAYAHQDLPFEKLVDELQPARDRSRTPLFQVALVLQNTPHHALQLPGLLVEGIKFNSGTAKFDITFEMEESDDAITGSLEYNTDLFDAYTMARLLRQFQLLITGIVADPDQPISKYSLLTDPERQQLLSQQTEPMKREWAGSCLHQLFHLQALHAPDRIAIVFGQQNLAYAELNRRANQLAHYLISRGVRPETIVGVCLDRGPDMIVTLLAILKAGGAYLPMEADYPADRLCFMLADAGAEHVVTDSQMAAKFATTRAELLFIDKADEQIAGQPQHQVAVSVGDENLAYIIYTSGSTGLPKGVMISHGNVVRLFEATKEEFAINEADVWTMFHSLAFDFSVWEVWGALLYGGKLAIVSDRVRREPSAFYDMIRREGVTMLSQTPSAFKQLMAEEDSRPQGEQATSLRGVIFGGERLEVGSLKKWVDRHGDDGPRLVNMYGITETTVHVTSRKITGEEVSSGVGSLIGEAIKDLQVYLLDEQMEMVAEGIKGEIYVAGAGLGRGYVSRGGLTAERYLPNPYARSAGERMYRSGDEARRVRGGELVYEGRGDNQVKVRGYRIELGEIEQEMRKEEGVRDSVVVVREDEAGVKMIVGYWVREEGSELRGGAIRKRLKERLPEHMIPGAIVRLEKMPLTKNGKVDRRALPAPSPDRPDLEQGIVAPQTLVEEVLAGIWSEVLGISQVGIHDNFFELGGDSIRSIQIRTKAQQRGLDLSIQDIFSHQTIYKLGKAINFAGQVWLREVDTQPFSLIAEEDRLRLPEDVEDAYPLSMLQKGMLFHTQYSQETPIYHNITSFHLELSLDIEKFRASLDQLATRHAILRTSFDLTNFSEPMQLVHKEASIPFSVEDLRGVPPEYQDEEIAAWTEKEKERKFDWTQAPLLRFQVHRRSEDTFQLSMTEHHAILDGWSVATLLTELFRIYYSLLDEEIFVDPVPQTTFRDFIALEQQSLQSDENNEYWGNSLRDSTLILLPRLISSDVTGNARKGRVREVLISPELCEGLRRFAQSAGVPLKSVLLGAHLRVLSLLTGQSDVVTGLVSNGRPEGPDGERVLGLFLNTLPFRLILSGGTWLELVEQTFQAERAMLPFRWYPLAQLQKAMGGRPLFEAAFNYTHFHVYQDIIKLKHGKFLDGQTFQQANFTFAAQFNVDIFTSQVHLVLEYDGSQLLDEQIESIAGYYSRAFAAMVDDPSELYEGRPLLSEQELNRLLVEWNSADIDNEQQRCIHKLFEEQVEKTPHHIALSFQHQSLSYLQLNSQANQLARRLLAEGLRPHSVVALCLERSLDLVVSIIACLKSGAAFLPLDPEYPADRLAFMLADSRARLLLTDRSLADRFPSVTTLLIDDGRLDTGLYGTDNLPPRATPSDLAYLIYTSGTTGSPKAVMVEHRNLAATLRAACKEFGFDHNDRMAVIASYSFDIFLFELMCPLLGGGRAVLLSKDEVLDVAGLVITIRGLTQLHCVPSLMRQILSHLAETGAQGGYQRLKRIYIGGDAVAADLLERMRGVFADSEIVVLYGPTETTIISSRHRVRGGEQGQRQLIGRAFEGERLLICDARANPLPVGVAGEILIAGHGLTRGYWGQEGLTEQKYISVLGERCYRTGDRGRYVAGGEVEFLGRLDQQIKIRGMRVEVGEVEAVLGRHEEVKGCVVVGVEDEGGEKRLVAYIVSRGNGESGVVRRVREYMKGSLPAQMQPAQYVEIEAIPVNRNGKVDRRALPEAVPERGELEKEYEEPQTEKQRKLVEIWGQVLGIEGIGIRDNFFELGGDSILSIQIIARANQAGMKLSPKQLFQNQTIAELAAVAEATAEVRAEQGVLSGEVMLTPIQRWFFAEGKKRPEHFNQSVMLEASRPFRVEGLRKAVAGLINHHDMLRLRVSGQGIQADCHLALEQEDVVVVIDLTEVAQTRLQEEMSRAGEQLQASLNLEQGPIVRVAVLDTASGSSVMIVIHHLAVDGVSWRILLDDLQKAYEQAAGGLEIDLGSKTSSYRQWAKALESYSQREQTSQEAAYWEGQKWLKVKPLPVDGQGENTAGSIEAQQVRLTEDETARLLREVPEAYHSKVEEVLVAALVAAVSKWTGERQLLIEMEGHGREEIEDDIDVTRTVGWFTAIYPLLIDVGEAVGLQALLKRVKQEIRGVPGKGISYGVMKFIAGAEAAQRLSTHLQPEISFNYLGQFDHLLRQAQSWIVSGGGIGREQSADESRNHLIEVNGLVSGSELSISFTYSRNCHLAQTIAGLAHQMIDSLRELIEASHTGSAQCLIASDFQAVELEQQEIERLAARYGLIEHIYPLTPLQEGLLFHTIYEPDSGIYVGQMRCQLKGELDAQAMSRAWMAEADRHDLLRSSIEWEGLKKPVLIVGSAARTQLRVEDWRGFEPRQQQALLDDYLREERRQGFDLGGGETMRVAIIRTGEQEHELLWSHHHMVLDGWSAAIVLKGVFGGYAKAVRGEAPEQEGEKRRGYGDYIRWLKRQDMTKAEQYWRAALKGFLTPTPLMPDYAAASRPQAETIHSKKETRLDQATTIALTAKARKQQLTISTLVQGAWALILSRYSGEPDVVFGSTVSGRPAAIAGIEQMVGLFINTLPMRVKVADDKELAQWLKEIQQQAVEMREYEYTPLVEAQRWSELSAGQGLFETILVYENYPVEKGLLEEVGGLEVERLRVEEKTNYPISVVVGPGQELVLRIEYEKASYEEGTIERVLEQMKRVLEGMGEEREKRVGELEMMREAEREEVIYKWNETARDYRRHLCIQEMFEEEVERRPESVAVIYEDGMVSYEELNRRANQLAHYLMGMGVGPEIVVGICAERSIEMVVGLLGILKAGGVYLPLDPSYPQERLAFIVEDSASSVLLTQWHLASLLSGCPSRLVFLDRDLEKLSDQERTCPSSGVTVDNLAYVIYTSGSTGKPKGAMIEHRAICNRLLWMQEVYQLTSKDRVLQKTPFSFDVSVWEFFWPLLNGAALVMAQPEGHRDPTYLTNLIDEQGITTLHFVPSMLKAFLSYDALESCASLRRVICSGEALTYELQDSFMQRLEAELHNLYGPTEAAVDVTYWKCERLSEKKIVPIGKPIANVQTHILNKRMQPVPARMPGELHIGGEALGRGYYHQPSMTAEKFIPNAFSREAGAKLYKTGDLVRYLPDGNIEFLGRLDHQVKIRGFRVEPGEIEAALTQHPAIQNAAVIAKEHSPQDKRLIAYLVPDQEFAPDSRNASDKLIADLRNSLKQLLPEYLVPSAFVILDTLPLTSSGKIDRRALPSPEEIASESGAAYSEPRNLLERTLASIWCEVLGLEQVGIYDKFLELGGDSILSIQVVARANQAGMKLSPKLLFQNQTIAELAAVAQASGEVKAEQGVLSGAVKLTPVQRRFFEQGMRRPNHFNQSVMLEASRPFRVEWLRKAVAAVINHHDMLRLRVSGQGIQADCHLALEQEDVVVVIDLTEVEQTRIQNVMRRAGERLQASLNLEQGPIVRVAVLDTAPGSNVMIVIHHLAVDGVSWRILLEDLQKAYDQAAGGLEIDLGSKTSSYRQWAKALESYSQREQTSQEATYWEGQKWLNVKPLPVDRQGENTAGSIKVQQVSLTEDETARLLREVPEAYHTRIDEVLVAALVAAVSKWTGEKQLLIEMEGHGREEIEDDIDVTRTVGWFTAIYPLLIEVGQGLEQTLKQVKQEIRSVPGKGISYGVMKFMAGAEAAERLGPQRQPEISFNYLGQFDQVMQESQALRVLGGGIGREQAEEEERKYLIEVNAMVTGGELEVSFSYSRNRHHQATIEHLANNFINVLQSLINGSLSVGMGAYIPSDFQDVTLNQDELQRILNTFNKDTKSAPR